MTIEKTRTATQGMQNLAVCASRSFLARISFFASGEWKLLRKAKLCIPKTLYAIKKLKIGKVEI